MNTYIDIETIPQQPEAEARLLIAATITAPAQMSKPETIQEWHDGTGKYAGVKEAAIDAEYRKTSFDGAKGQICSIAWAVEDGPVETGLPVEAVGEAGLLADFFKSVYASMKGRSPFFIGHYISGFDLRYLYHRAVINKVSPGFNLGMDGRHGKDYYDTMTAWAGYKDRISQDNLCKALGMEGKPADIDGSKVWDFYKAGRYEEIRQYNAGDVEKVRTIYNRLNFNQEQPAVFDWWDDNIPF